MTLLKHRDIKQRQTKLLKETQPKKVTNHRECVGSYNATGLVTVSLDAYQHTQPRGNLPGLHQVQKNKASNKALERFQSSLNVWLLQSTINKLKHTGMLLRWEIMTLSVTGSGKEKTSALSLLRRLWTVMPVFFNAKKMIFLQSRKTTSKSINVNTII